MVALLASGSTWEKVAENTGSGKERCGALVAKEHCGKGSREPGKGL